MRTHACCTLCARFHSFVKRQLSITHFDFQKEKKNAFQNRLKHCKIHRLIVIPPHVQCTNFLIFRTKNSSLTRMALHINGIARARVAMCYQRITIIGKMKKSCSSSKLYSKKSCTTILLQCRLLQRENPLNGENLWKTVQKKRVEENKKKQRLVTCVFVNWLIGVSFYFRHLICSRRTRSVRVCMSAYNTCDRSLEYEEEKKTRNELLLFLGIRSIVFPFI